MELKNLAVPSVYALICFLAYSSQVLFLYLEPHPLDRDQAIRFNALLACLFISYSRSVAVDPGHIPKSSEKEIDATGKKTRQRWCRKCEAVKPPRAHHCKQCKRCIPKMDHHCPWTQNCVSHTTFPHFIRFLFYAVVCMSYLAYFLWIRFSLLWENRHLPSYLGPSIFHLGHLFLLIAANSFTLFALSMLLIRNIWCLAVNTTTIEGWEIERHKTLLRRSRAFGGFLDGPEGTRVRIERQEFPYDVGIWTNFKLGMGTANMLAWFWPLAATPLVSTGLSFPINDFEAPTTTWPPPDPDRMSNRRAVKDTDFNINSEAFTYRDAELTPMQTVAAFRKRQDDDVVRRRKPFVARVEAWQARQGDASAEPGSYGELDAYETYGEEYEGAGEFRYGDEDVVEEHAEEGQREQRKGQGSPGGNESGEEGWRNSEGERLRDFGVDEDVEFYDEEEDDVPLSTLLARKREAAAAGYVVGGEVE
ncbi:zf-DHHC-domain-containing protein [Amniculicola lignicola CBS 123094]|uniref:Palmitoyltransferase PFA4 n=1 Tax=Amniculicola lignicola CBS 123094 TaxID=1392246 RepID=A0A6A5W4S2_9PLEO|nr:zf-DHHC-domain-containing protein [Amniculicola lignicola CBS 123094]